MFVAVTTTTQSALALEMLRKHRNDFDLVICEVNMPDIDGFQLLQQVVEMNFPVVSKFQHLFLPYSEFTGIQVIRTFQIHFNLVFVLFFLSQRESNEKLVFLL